MNVGMKTVLAEFVLAPFYAIGWIAGIVARAARWCWDAAVVGYEAARAGREHHE